MLPTITCPLAMAALLNFFTKAAMLPHRITYTDESGVEHSNYAPRTQVICHLDDKSRPNRDLAVHHLTRRAQNLIQYIDHEEYMLELGQEIDQVSQGGMQHRLLTELQNMHICRIRILQRRRSCGHPIVSGPFLVENWHAMSEVERPSWAHLRCVRYVVVTAEDLENLLLAQDAQDKASGSIRISRAFLNHDRLQMRCWSGFGQPTRRRSARRVAVRLTGRSCGLNSCWRKCWTVCKQGRRHVRSEIQCSHAKIVASRSCVRPGELTDNTKRDMAGAASPSHVEQWAIRRLKW